MRRFRQSGYWVHSTTQRDVEQFKGVQLECGWCRDDLHGVVVHDDGVLGDGGQAGNQSLKAMNGLAVVGALGKDFLKSLGRTRRRSDDGLALGLCGRAVMIIK